MLTAQSLWQLFAPIASKYVQDLGLRVLEVRPGEVVLALPVAPALVHGGGVLCGQAILSAVDTAMVLALFAHFGESRRCTTVQLQTSFLRAVPGDSGEVRVIGRVLKCGRSLAFGEIEVLGADGQLAAHATTTYALL